MTLATRAQQWYRTPAILGGGGRSFSGITPDVIRFPEQNENGSYSISGDLNTCTIIGTGLEPQANPGVATISITPDSIFAPTWGGGWVVN
ncbi:MAG: hypothetical protein GF353_19270 [Candidatus Lokiarchaeota archaeon]|nr:hypothetical protein [Candidatus Lokiarchaeota archaeon]